jgi:2-methylcitrate dehydratase PrpD
MLARAFGSFVSETGYDLLPAPVVDAVKLRVLDLLGAGIAGHRLGNGSVVAPLMSGPGPCSVWGNGRRAGVRDAALANSYLAHSTLLEDGSRFTGGHPSSVVIPGALAFAEAHHATGKRLIAAVAAGYEVFLRLGRAIYPSTVNRGFQSTGVLGSVSCAAAGASILGLDARASQQAVAIGASLGVSLKEALKSARSGAVQVGRSCEGGVCAALLAAAGEGGAELAIENGFVPAFSDGADLAGVAEGLGTDYRIFETYLKRHAGCRGNHAPIDVVVGLVRTHAIDLERIAGIDIAVDSVTHAGEVVEPATAAQAQFNIPFSVALALIDGGEASLFAYTEERMADLRTRRLAEKISVHRDTRLDADYPDKRRALATLTLADGHVVQGSIENAEGEPGSPLDPSEVERKFLNTATPALGSKATTLMECVASLEDVEDVLQLTTLLVADRPPKRKRHEPRSGRK